MVTGNVYPEVEKKLRNIAVQDAARRLPQSGRRQVRRTDRAGRARQWRRAHSSRGCAFGDFDNDGDLDILIVNLNEPPSLLRNDVTGKQHWLKVKLKGVSRTAAPSARALWSATAERCRRRTCSASRVSIRPTIRRLHFGLGSSARSISRFSGQRSARRHNQIPANQLITFREGAGQISNRGWAKT